MAEGHSAPIIQGDMNQMMALLSQTGQRSGGGRLGYHLLDDAYYPSGTLRSPDIIRVLPATYRQELLLKDQAMAGDWPFFTWREHRDTRTFKSAVCSGGLFFFDQERRDPCHGCSTYYDLRKKDEKGKWQEGWLTSRQQHSVSLIHFHEYQYVPQKDKKTGAVKTKNDGSAFMAWQRSIGDPQADTIPCRKMRWDFGSTYRTLLLQANSALFYCCRSCGSKDSIRWDAVVCGNPECEAPIYQREDGDLTTAQIEEIDKQSNDMYLCPACGQTHLPKKYFSCENCDNPEPSSIFDVNLHLYMLETRSPGARKATKTLQLAGYSDPHPIMLPDGLTDEEAEFMVTPFDLPTLLAPTSMADQVAIIGAKRETQTRTPSNSSREYNK